MKLNVRLAGCMLLAAGLSLWQIENANAVVLTPSNAFLSQYHFPRIGGAGQPETRASAFAVLTDGVIDHGGGSSVQDNIDTFNLDGTGVTLDFVGLQYAAPEQFDALTVELGTQFSDGGDWQSTPRLFILKNPALVGGDVEPNMSPNWVEVTGAVETTGHVFSPVAVAGVGGTLKFDLSAIPVANRSGYGWALGGVNGAGGNTFISPTEASASGVSGAGPAMALPLTPVASNLVSNAYHTPGRNGHGLLDSRGQGFAAVSDGIVMHNSVDEGFDAFDGGTTQSDFVGEQYGSQYRFDSLSVELAHQFGDGGDWGTTPKIYILKNPVDTNTTRPETDAADWSEVTGALETTGHVFSTTALNGAGGSISFDLSSIPAALRTGWGWAIGGVDGNGAAHFISVSELRATGALVPEPASLMLLTLGGFGVSICGGRRRGVN